MRANTACSRLALRAQRDGRSCPGRTLGRARTRSGGGGPLLDGIRAASEDSIRLNDVVVRTGGEEFLVVLKNTDMACLDLFATKILGKIGEQSFVLSEVEGRTIHKTCSVGYSAFPLVDAEPDRYNFEQIMMLADQALYYAKAHGRNQAVRVLAGLARPENPEQTEKLLRNLE